MAKVGDIVFPETPGLLKTLGMFGEVGMDPPKREGWWFSRLYARSIGICGETIGMLRYDSRCQTVSYEGKVAKENLPKLLEHLQRNGREVSQRDIPFLVKLVGRDTVLGYHLQDNMRFSEDTDENKKIPFP